MSNGKVMFWILVVGLLGVSLLIACGGGEEPTQVPSAPEVVSGAELLQERCTSCHGLDRVERESYSQAEWDASVERMRGYGAELTDDEAQTLVEYLVENYGP